MPGKVADTSVLAALIFREPRATEAASLLQDADLYEPPLLAYELTSVARKKSMGSPEIAPVIAQALALGLQTAFIWVEVAQMDVLRLALAAGLTTYDASYLYVARAYGLELLTFDARLSAAARR